MQCHLDLHSSASKHANQLNHLYGQIKPVHIERAIEQLDGTKKDSKYYMYLELLLESISRDNSGYWNLVDWEPPKEKRPRGEKSEREQKIRNPYQIIQKCLIP